MATRFIFSDGRNKPPSSRGNTSTKRASSPSPKMEKEPIQMVLYFYITSGETLVVNYLEDIYFFQADCLDFFQSQGFGGLKSIYWEAYSFYPNEFPTIPRNLSLNDDSRIIRVFVAIIPENYPENYEPEYIGYLFAQTLLESIRDYLQPNIQYLGLEPSFAVAKSDSVYADAQIKTPDVMLCFDADQFSYDFQRFEIIVGDVLNNTIYKLMQNKNQFCISFLHPQDALKLVEALRMDYTFSIIQLSTYEELTIEQLEDLSSNFGSYFPESDIITFQNVKPTIKSTDGKRYHLKKRFIKEQIRE